MFQKKMQRAAMILLMAALLLTAPLQATGWTIREDPGLLETAWGWLVEWVIGNELPITPDGQPGGEIPVEAGGDDGGAIDPNG
jgi:hypothetical protein